VEHYLTELCFEMLEKPENNPQIPKSAAE